MRSKRLVNIDSQDRCVWVRVRGWEVSTVGDVTFEDRRLSG